MTGELLLCDSRGFGMSDWITLPPQFKPGLVLQQQAVTSLLGHSDASLNLTLQITRKPYDPKAVSPLDPNYGIIFSATVKTDKKGRFTVDLPPLKASFDPLELHITDGQRALDLDQILVGELYLLIGELTDLVASPAQAGKSLPQQAKTPFLRFYDLTAAGDGANWQTPEQPDDLRGFSTLGLLFGQNLLPEIRQPIGILQGLMPGQRTRDWQPSHTKSSPAQLLLPVQQTSLRGIIWSAPTVQPGSHQPANPATNLATNSAANVAEVTDLQKLVEQLRERLHPVDNQPAAWMTLLQPAVFRGQQNPFEMTQAIENLVYCRHHLAEPTALVPLAGADPAISATRLSTICQGLLYQYKAPASAPECAAIEKVGGKLMISFSNAGEGLRLMGDDTRVRGFAVCGPDRIYRPAQAKVLYGVRVMVWHDDIPNPIGVTYAYADNFQGNLISKDQLPVVPFRSDQTPSVYASPREWAHCDDPSDWQIFDGQATFKLEKANKSEGEAALLLTYQGPSTRVAFGPWIDRREDFPPLDLSAVASLKLDVFNTDHREKTLQLQVLAIDAPGASEAITPALKILPALRWQTLAFDLAALATAIDRAQIIRLKFILSDPTGRGTLYLDNIRL